MRGLVRAELVSLCSRQAATHREDLAAADALEAHDCYHNGDRGTFVLRELIDRALTDLEATGEFDDPLPPLE